MTRLDWVGDGRGYEPWRAGPRSSPPSAGFRFRSAALLGSLLLVVGACSGGNSANEPVPVPETVSTTTTTEAAETTQSADATDQPANDPTALELTWGRVWAAAGAIEADKPTALGDVQPLLSAEAMTFMEGVLGGEVEREITTHPVLVEQDDGSIFINDCLYIRPPALVGVANWYEGRATQTGGQWIIESVNLQSGSGCVPAVVADEVIADYLEFREIREQYWNPPQPDHPGVTETMTGEHLAYIVDLLEQDRENGWYFVDSGTEYHPEIMRVETPTRIVVSDCSIPSTERGYFDQDGNRQEGIEEATPDQRNINEATMVLEDGEWKVESLAGQPGVSCELAPSVNGVVRI